MYTFKILQQIYNLDASTNNTALCGEFIVDNCVNSQAFTCHQPPLGKYLQMTLWKTVNGTKGYHIMMSVNEIVVCGQPLW